MAKSVYIRKYIFNIKKWRIGNMADIIGLGQVTVDEIYILQFIPKIDEVVFVKKRVKQQGGMVTTALKTISRLGGSVEFIGGIGDDDNGKYVLDVFRDGNIDIKQVEIFKNQATAYSVILVDKKTGKRTIINNPGVQKADLKLKIPDITGAKIIHLDGSWFETAVESARLAREKGITISIDLSPSNYDSKVFELIKLCNYIIVPWKFAKYHTMKATALMAGRKLLEYGPDVVIITKGQNGSLLISEDKEFEIPAFQVSVKDTTGAGDSFHGGFLFGLTKNYNLKEAVIFASAVAALNCTKIGGQGGLPTFQEVKKFLANYQ